MYGARFMMASYSNDFLRSWFCSDVRIVSVLYVCVCSIFDTVHKHSMYMYILCMNSTLKYKEIVHNIAKHTQQSIGVVIVRKDYKLSWLQNRKKYGGDDWKLDDQQ